MTLPPWLRTELRLLLGEPRNGRLGRSSFVRALLVLAAAAVAFAVVFGGLFWMAEALSDVHVAWLERPARFLAIAAQAILFAVAGFAFLIGPAIGFGFLNVIAKRCRDIGLPGWPATLVACMLGTAFSLGAPPVARNVFLVLTWAALLGLRSAPGRPPSTTQPGGDERCVS
ncbi:MAG: DUF805 domain-containing protein [Pseudomonadota bacterium]